MDKFLDRYRFGSARLQKWNYRWKGAYFISICTQGRECYFGDVVEGKMKLSGIGIIADILWYEIKNHSKNVDLGAFVVMPNHVHGILILNEWIDNGGDETIALTHNADTMHAVETTHALSLHPHPHPQSDEKIPEIPPESSKTSGQKRFQNTLPIIPQTGKTTGFFLPFENI